MKLFLATALALCFSVATAAAETRVLRVSHQWSANDIRHEVAEVMAREVAAADVGLEIQIFPKRALYEPYSQYEPLMSGELDMSIYTLAYSGDRHPEYNLTLMPALVKNHDHAKRLLESDFMAEIEGIMAKDGVRVLVHGYLAGGFAGTEGCVRRPSDVDGKPARAAGAAFEAMLAGAGAKIHNMPSSKLHQAFGEGMVEVANTSSASFVSYKLYERVVCFTPVGDYALWFVYIPILMSESVFDSLTPVQQDALLAAAAEAEAYYAAEAAGQDAMARRVFEEKGIEIVDMDEIDYAEWFGVAKVTAYEAFLARSPNGMRLLDMALSVE